MQRVPYCTIFLGWDLLGNIVISRIIIIRYGCIVFLRLRSSANKLEILKKIACLDGGAGKELVWSGVKLVKNKLIMRKIYSTLFLLFFFSIQTDDKLSSRNCPWAVGVPFFTYIMRKNCLDQFVDQCLEISLQLSLYFLRCKCVMYVYVFMYVRTYYKYMYFYMKICCVI